MRQTPLHSVHRDAGARMVPFAGYDMPVSYADITAEHHAVRQAAGLFDLSHMGRVRFRGPDRDQVAHRALTFDCTKLAVGRTRYALICNDAGGIQDDILISREEDALLLVVNAGNRDEDVAFFQACAEGLDATVDDETDQLAMLAIQGPNAEAIMLALDLPQAAELKYYKHCVADSTFGELTLSRTGYTGEDGFEIILASDQAPAFWAKALEVGQAHGLIACGLGARDTLRLEAGMPLHGHEISAEVNPFEAGLDFAVRSKQPYRGADALARVKEDGPTRLLIGLDVEGPRIPRADCPVLLNGEEVGVICSGTRSPTLDRNIATALVSKEAADAGGPYTIRIRRAEATATRTDMPFYKRDKEN